MTCLSFFFGFFFTPFFLHCSFMVKEVSPSHSNSYWFPRVTPTVTSKMLRSLLSLTIFASSAYALAYNAPRPTSEAEFGDLVFPPDPTPAAVAPAELFRRQDVYTPLIAPDNTCGYISGLPGMYPKS
jgi:hypothetical protein